MDPTAPPLAHPIRCLHEEPWAPCFDDFENRTRLDGAQHKAVAAGILGDHPNRLDLDGAICLSHGWFAMRPTRRPATITGTTLHTRRLLIISSTAARADPVGLARVGPILLADDSASHYPDARPATTYADPVGFGAQKGPLEDSAAQDRTPRVCSSCSGYRHNRVGASIESRR